MEKGAHVVFGAALEGPVCLFVVGRRFLSAEEAGLLLSDAVLPLPQSQFRTVPPETQNIPETLIFLPVGLARVKTHETPDMRRPLVAVDHRAPEPTSSSSSAPSWASSGVLGSHESQREPSCTFPPPATNTRSRYTTITATKPRSARLNETERPALNK